MQLCPSAHCNSFSVTSLQCCKRANQVCFSTLPLSHQSLWNCTHELLKGNAVLFAFVDHMLQDQFHSSTGGQRGSVMVPSQKRLEETVFVRFTQEVELLRHRDWSGGDDACWNQERPDETTVQSSSRPEERSDSPRGHRLDSPVQRSDLQAADRKTARLHWRQSCKEEQRPELGNCSD